MTHAEIAKMIEALVAIGLDPESVGYFVLAEIGLISSKIEGANAGDGNTETK